MANGLHAFFLDEVELVISVLDPFSFFKFSFHQDSERRDLDFDRQYSFHPIDKRKWGSTRRSANLGPIGVKYKE